MAVGGYSRFIYYVKIILPLIAIGLLATVFLFTTPRTLEGGLTFSKADLLTLQGGMQIDKPRFSGSNTAGDIYDFSAELVQPDAPKPSLLDVSGLSGEIRFIKGGKLLLGADKAEYRIAEQELRMLENVMVLFSEGFYAKTTGLLAELRSGRLISDGFISASAPMGEIEAGLLRIEQDSQENRMIWFENGVKLTLNVQNTADRTDSE